MPWPMPRWVMSSPSHMTNAVPGGHRQHDQQDPADGELRDEVDVGEALTASEEAAATVVEDEGQAGRLHDRQGDGQVAGVWVSFFWPTAPFLTPLLELGDHHDQQLDDDLGR